MPAALVTKVISFVINSHGIVESLAAEAGLAFEGLSLLSITYHFSKFVLSTLWVLMLLLLLGVFTHLSHCLVWVLGSWNRRRWLMLESSLFGTFVCHLLFTALWLHSMILLLITIFDFLLMDKSLITEGCSWCRCCWGHRWLLTLAYKVVLCVIGCLLSCQFGLLILGQNKSRWSSDW